MSAASRQLSTAAERREALIEAAAVAFAERGFHGTPTTAIAKAAGISQAYLFRLFPTKEELYVAAVERCYERLRAAMRAGAERARADGVDPLDGMGLAYVELTQDRTTLQSTLQAFAAAAGDEGVIRDAARRGYAEMWELVRRLSGADDEELRSFFAHGMLITVLAGMDAPAVDAAWVRSLLGDEAAQQCAPPAATPTDPAAAG
ncbi:TetR/AcrR family transcriptional regulator [Conexibacter woesei]|uniref:Transcriptional regulator, TetR family n=1 Tax=Conexibacter woesei (strain DSM 14684 / CCUG 47730 / CIP 108061 / JCM 11494 / NBRC 100937 / ID131577) TaxID=469383 RepID=D3FBN4_CONWI|nr:TetR/AcrR family transcriptional regulator [Conexibacter woesei]ADB49403.1 transcriptional regulator, TetR family [Conexibacter woesei DSM 14684]